MKVAAVIPAFNEAKTVGDIVRLARSAEFIDEVIVTDNGSTDDTGAVAEREGARVLRVEEGGKGEAMVAGVRATDAQVILFLDADLTGLRLDHLEKLVRPVVEGSVGMTCGLFDRGDKLNPVFLERLPILTGERAMRRELFESLSDDDVSGYRIEAALNLRANELGLDIKSFVLDGMFHRTKEEKSQNPAIGALKKVGMLTIAGWTYASWPFRKVARKLLVKDQAERARRSS